MKASKIKIFILIICAISLVQSLESQEIPFIQEDFLMTGTTVIANERCFQLTENELWQGGGVWFKNRITLSEAFSIELNLFFGCDDAGADGMVFILHPELRTGSRGEGMGFGRLVPSFGVEMDTYLNPHLSDPYHDHVSFMNHGLMSHYYGLSEPVSLNPDQKDVEDCDYHRVKIDWNPDSRLVSFFFDGNLRVQKKVNLIESIFDGEDRVYWGFTSATGAKMNRHLVCVDKLEFEEAPELSNRDFKDLMKERSYTLQDLEFPSGSARLPENAKSELDLLIDFFKNHEKRTIILDGFTDSSGSEAQNRQISERRVKAISNYMVSQGIPQRRIQYYGNGEIDPVAPNDTPEGRKENRRVEVRFVVIKV